MIASGTEPLAYQWKKSDEEISGATSDSYSIAFVIVADEGSYTVTVSNEGGDTDSDPAILTVHEVAPNPGGIGSPNDAVRMPNFNANAPGLRLRDTQLGTGNTDDTLREGLIDKIGLILRDEQSGSANGDAVNNAAGQNPVKEYLDATKSKNLQKPNETFAYPPRQ